MLPELTGHGLQGRVLIDTGPKEAKGRAPGRCAPPVATQVSSSVIAVEWADVLDDGGEDIFNYELQWATLDLLDPEAPPPWASAYTGLQRRTFESEPHTRCAGPGAFRAQCAPLKRPHRGCGRFEFAKGIAADADYAFRVRCANASGQGEWSKVLRVTTPKRSEAALVLAPLPPSWVDLRRHIADLLEPKVSGVDPDILWSALTGVLQKHQVPRQRGSARGGTEPIARHLPANRGALSHLRIPTPASSRLLSPSLALARLLQVPLKIAFRLYSLIGSGVDGGVAIDMTQFRRFVDECKIRFHSDGGAGTMSTATVDLIFARCNRELPPEKPGTAASTASVKGSNLGGRGSPSSPKDGGEGGRSGSPEGVSNDENPDLKLMQFEFVHAVLRLAKARCEQPPPGSAEAPSLTFGRLRPPPLAVSHLPSPSLPSPPRLRSPSPAFARLRPGWSSSSTQRRRSAPTCACRCSRAPSRRSSRAASRSTPPSRCPTR